MARKTVWHKFPRCARPCKHLACSRINLVENDHAEYARPIALEPSCSSLRSSHANRYRTLFMLKPRRSGLLKGKQISKRQGTITMVVADILAPEQILVPIEYPDA
jgi:hypothetical protein